MVWNHRVVKREHKHADGTVEITYQIHEAFYDKKGAPADTITLEPIAPLGETLVELREELERMLRATNRCIGEVPWDEDKAPVLNYEDF